MVDANRIKEKWFLERPNGVWSVFVQLALHDAEQDAAKEQQKDKNISGKVQNDNDTIHKR